MSVDGVVGQPGLSEFNHAVKTEVRGKESRSSAAAEREPGLAVLLWQGPIRGKKTLPVSLIKRALPPEKLGTE